MNKDCKFCSCGGLGAKMLHTFRFRGCASQSRESKHCKSQGFGGPAMKLCKSISGLSKVSKTLRCQSFVGCLAGALYLNLHFSQWDWDVPGDSPGVASYHNFA